MGGSGVGVVVLGRPGPLLERPTAILLPPLMTNPHSSGSPEATELVSAQSALTVTISDLLTIC
jgi:hypothetical protein